MKTAISINDEIFFEAEKTALLMGLSRSKLYARAITDFVQNHNPDIITARLNTIFDTEVSELDDEINQVNFDLVNTEEW